MANKDYYQTLGINKGASAEEIKSAYRSMAKKYHPDVFATADESKRKEAEIKFKEVQHAYDVLSDPQKKEAFDQYGSEDGPMGGGYGGGGFNPFGSGGFGEDLFSNIFNAFTGGGTRRQEQNIGDDIEAELYLTFKEAAFGVEKEITFTRKEKCKTCGGSGAKNASSIRVCATCNGSGSVKTSQRTPFGIIQSTKTCHVCGGEGKIVEEKCADCRGSGMSKVKRTIKVKIPAGIDNGQMLSMQSEGNAASGASGRSGNLILIFKVERHPLFAREGFNIHMELPITFIQAALGAKIDVPTLTSPVSVEIPAGTQHGTIIRVKDKGIKYLKKDVYGDLYIKVVIDIPKNLSYSQKNKLKETEEALSKAKYEQVENYNKNLKNC